MSKIILAEQAAAPDTPGSGKAAMYVDANGVLAVKDDAGNVTKIGRGEVLTAAGIKPTANSTAAIQLQSAAGTPILTIDSTNGKVNVAALQIGGVDVPYAAGTWTPALKFGGAAVGMTYSAQSGYYWRMGGLVYVEGLIVLSALGSSTGAATITGLPVNNTTNGGFMVRYASSLAAITEQMIVYASANSLLLGQMASNSWAALTHANFTASSRIDVAGFYLV